MIDKTYLITGGSGFIGTHLIDLLINNCVSNIINIDKRPPKLESQFKYWCKCDILIKEDFKNCIEKFKPNYIIHLAAETNVNGRDINFYDANTIGVKNLLEIVNASKDVERLIITSTQYVHQFHGIPNNDQEYYPLGLYGKSKVITEQLTRNENLKCIWTIIRPTTIWGPWHNIYPHGFWYEMYRGRYFHPGSKLVIRSYGYVENVVFQILRLLEADKKLIDRKVFYVGDEPVNLISWVNAFSIALTGKKVRILPRFVFRILSLIGDVLRLVGISFPLNSLRYKNMITSNPCDMKRTFSVTGKNSIDLETGVEKTVKWYLKTYQNILNPHK